MLLNSQNNQQITFTQGDDTVLSLIATDDQGVPVDLTGATLSTQILGPNGIGPVTFPNSQHTIAPDQLADRGKFTLALSASDTGSCGEGSAKQIITESVIEGLSVYYRGVNLLIVYVSTPIQ